MMTPETRRFYTGYRMLTSILPVYLLTAVFFFVGWYLNPSRPGNSAFLFGGLLLFVGISRLVTLLGFRLSVVPRSVVQPDNVQSEKINTALNDFDGPIESKLVELGNIPFLAVGGGMSPAVWVSTYTLERLSPDDLSCLLVHEGEHLREGCLIAWWDLLWLAVWPLAWLLAEQPAYYLASSVVFAWAWLRLQGWLRFREEVRAGQAAVKACGREQYARAMVRHLAEFETVPDSPLRRSRLAALGFTEPETEELLRDNAHSSSVP